MLAHVDLDLHLFGPGFARLEGWSLVIEIDLIIVEDKSVQFGFYV
jgi:hypothetical protein